MLDLAVVDLDMLESALEDRSYESTWFLDRQTGEVIYRPDDLAGEFEEEMEDRDLVVIEADDPHAAYRDMADFVAGIADERTRELLTVAIQGPGAFRRFKDTLYRYPDLWDEFSGIRRVAERRRAIEWLRDNELVADADADAALAEL